jgi:hypothetical protein
MFRKMKNIIKVQQVTQNLLFVILLLAIFGCNAESPKQKGETDEITKPKTDAVAKDTLPKFEDIKEMFAWSSDFSEDNGTLKFISLKKTDLRVQVSKPVIQEDSDENKNDIVKRDIVYVVFQVFALTNLEKVTVTAVPYKFGQPKKYINKYKKTVTVTRKKAKSILDNYLWSKDFSILYEKNGEIWVPSKEFSRLKFDRLNDIFGEISKK